MPELPDLEVIAEFLDERLSGVQITGQAHRGARPDRRSLGSASRGCRLVLRPASAGLVLRPVGCRTRRPPRSDGAAAGAALDQELFHGALELYPHVVADHVAFHSRHDLASVVGSRENAPSTLHHRWHAALVEKVKQVLYEEVCEDPVQEAPPAAKVSYKVGEIGLVGDVAASLAREAQFVAQMGRFLQQ